MLRQMFQKWHNIVQSSVFCAAIELWKHDHVFLVERYRFISEIQVDNFLDRAAKVAEVFDILAVPYNSALASQDALECLHIWVQCHSDFLNHTALLITE